MIDAKGAGLMSGVRFMRGHRVMRAPTTYDHRTPLESII